MGEHPAGHHPRATHEAATPPVQAAAGYQTPVAPSTARQSSVPRTAMVQMAAVPSGAATSLETVLQVLKSPDNLHPQKKSSSIVLGDRCSATGLLADSRHL